MSGMTIAIGRVNPAIGAGKRNDAWGILGHLKEFEDISGDCLSLEPTPVQTNCDYILRAIHRLYQLCCFTREGQDSDFASRVREFALSTPLLPMDPIPLSLFALSAYVVDHGLKSMPTRDAAEKISGWYLHSYLAKVPYEISPSDFATLRRLPLSPSCYPALCGLEAIAWLESANEKSVKGCGASLRSGQNAFTGHIGGGTRYLVQGDWYPPENDRCWSRPWSAMLQFDIDRPCGSEVLIELDLELPVRPTQRGSLCKISLNGNHVRTLSHGGEYSLRWIVPGKALLPRLNTIGFHPLPFRPAEFGSHDQRELGTCLKRLRVCLDI